MYSQMLLDSAVIRSFSYTNGVNKRDRNRRWINVKEMGIEMIHFHSCWYLLFAMFYSFSKMISLNMDKMTFLYLRVPIHVHYCLKFLCFSEEATKGPMVLPCAAAGCDPLSCDVTTLFSSGVPANHGRPGPVTGQVVQGARPSVPRKNLSTKNEYKSDTFCITNRTACRAVARIWNIVRSGTWGWGVGLVNHIIDTIRCLLK